MRLEFDLTCPGCRKKFKQAVAEMQPGRNRRCPHCGITIKFTGDDGRKAQKSLDDLSAQIKRLNKTLRIKL